jgi:cytidylate kinase
MKLKFDNLAISGGVAVGKNTLINNLQSYLGPYGWKFSSSGQIIRDYTKENVLPLATLAPSKVHRKIEDRVREVFEKEKNWAIEGWLAGFVARDLTNTLRVLLICSENSVRVDRVANRDKVTVEEAKKFIRLREEENFKKWKEIYGDYDFFNPKYFHLVVDTFSSGPLETVGKVLDKLGYDNGKITINKK